MNFVDAPLRRMLSPQECAVLLLMAEGLSNAEIGERMNLKGDTIKTYNAMIYRKLGVNNRVRAARLVWENPSQFGPSTE